MFGRQNDEQSAKVQDIHPAPDTAAPLPAAAVAATPTDTTTKIVAPSSDPAKSATSDDPAWSHPGRPITAAADTVNPAKPASAPARPVAEPSDLVTLDDTLHDLLNIKQQVLSNLSPLIHELDQPPVDRFRTLMMMIQASDDQSLIKEAYAVAQTIEDEKARAQALLDIINEINYFTSQHQEA